MLDAYIKWFQAHERVAIVALAVVLGFYGFSKYADIAARNADVQVAIAKQAQVAQDDRVKQMQAQLDQQSLQFSQAQAQMKQEMTILAAAIAQRDSQSQTKIVEVTAPGKTPSQAVADLTAAYPTLPAPVTTTSTGAEVPTVDVQQFTATKIEDETAKADLQDTRKELKSATDNLVSASSLITGQATQITNLNADIKKHDATCEDEKKQIKADARKGKLHAFLEGAATAAAILIRFIK